MLLSIVFFLLSIIPSAFIVVWLMNRNKEDLKYRKSCNSAIIRGAVAILPIIAVSGTFQVLSSLLKATVLGNVHPLVHQFVHDFFVLAFAEELVKYLLFRSLLKKRFNNYSLADGFTPSVFFIFVSFLTQLYVILYNENENSVRITIFL